MPRMGILTDYFVASSDTEAAGFLSSGVDHLPDEKMLECKGIDPWVMLGTLESILTGTPYEALADDPRPVAQDVEQFVCTVRPALTEALVAAAPERLNEAATPWSQTEELAGSDPDVLADFLNRLSDLARTAVTGGQRMYCRVSV